MKELLDCIRNLKKLSKKYKIDISEEINCIFRRINKLPKLALTAEGNQSSTNKTKNNTQKNKNNKDRIANTINFKIRSKINKGISTCDYCHKKHLNCHMQTLFNGSTKNVCNFCLKKIKEKNYWQFSKSTLRQDALDHAISGSYGSGKRSR